MQRVFGAKRTNLHEKYDYPVDRNLVEQLAEMAFTEVAHNAVFIGGPNPALRDEQPYSPAHHAAVCQKFGDPAALDRARAARAAASISSSVAPNRP